MIKVLTKYIIEGEPRKEKKMNEYGVSGYFYDGEDQNNDFDTVELPSDVYGMVKANNAKEACMVFLERIREVLKKRMPNLVVNGVERWTDKQWKECPCDKGYVNVQRLGRKSNGVLYSSLVFNVW